MQRKLHNYWTKSELRNVNGHFNGAYTLSLCGPASVWLQWWWHSALWVVNWEKVLVTYLFWRNFFKRHNPEYACRVKTCFTFFITQFSHFLITVGEDYILVCNNPHSRAARAAERKYIYKYMLHILDIFSWEIGLHMKMEKYLWKLI